MQDHRVYILDHPVSSTIYRAVADLLKIADTLPNHPDLNSIRVSVVGTLTKAKTAQLLFDRYEMLQVYDDTHLTSNARLHSRFSLVSGILYESPCYCPHNLLSRYSIFLVNRPVVAK